MIMRRLLSVFLAVCLFCALVPTEISNVQAISNADIAYPVVGGNIYFNKEAKTVVDCDSSVTAADIPSKIEGIAVTSIGSSAFSDCTSLMSVTIPESVTSIGNCAFEGCTILKSAVVRARVSELPRFIFRDCQRLTSITLPECLTTIGVGAFSSCTFLTDITLPQGLTTIDSGAFCACKSLTRIVIPEGVTELDSTFAHCSGLRHIILPSNLQRIGRGTFWACTALDDIEIPESVTTIGPLAFSGCSALERFVIPKNTTRIDYGALAGCPELTSIQVAADNPCYINDISGVLFSRDKSELVQYPAGLSGIYTIPDGVTRIGEFAFEGCSKLTGVILPKSVMQLGDSAFANCSGGMKLCFLGDAPQTEEHTFNLWSYYIDAASGGPTYEADVSDLIICYTEGSTGWTEPTWADFPTAIWNGKTVPHTHSYTAVVTAPTCTEQGYTTFTCTICNTSYQDSYIDALGHSWDTGRVTTAPTVEKEGKRTFTCIRCGAVKTETIAKLPPVIVAFSDVENDAYYAVPVNWAVAKNITNGTSATTFEPDATCTRGQIVTFMWRAAGQPIPNRTENPFRDVTERDYYYAAVLWAVENGITTGTSETTFSPSDGCTRGQVATFLWRYEGKPRVVGSNPFADVRAKEYYYDAVLWAVGCAITNGTSATTFEPKATCTRGQIVTFLYRDVAE